jgi:hypothetical protein
LWFIGLSAAEAIRAVVVMVEVVIVLVVVTIPMVKWYGGDRKTEHAKVSSPPPPPMVPCPCWDYVTLSVIGKET